MTFIKLILTATIATICSFSNVLAEEKIEKKSAVGIAIQCIAPCNSITNSETGAPITVSADRKVSPTVVSNPIPVQR